MRSVKHHISKLRFRHPRGNLPPRSARRRSEELFTLAFAREYSAKFSGLHSPSPKVSLEIAREIPVNGFGIADIIAVVWASPVKLEGVGPVPIERFMSAANPTIRAFEVKLADWRKGLMQAYRYRFFAHTALVVVPLSLLRVASRYVRTFRRLGVGLWGFEADERTIRRVYTPRPRKPQSRRYEERALHAVARATRSRRFS